MLSPADLQTFEQVARNTPNFRKWIAGELDKQHQILVQQQDEVQVRRAQGYAMCLTLILTQLDIAMKR